MTENFSSIKNYVNIHIGEYYSSREPAVISTVLGPCVAVCLHDKTTKIGGMNHILMPGEGKSSSSKPGKLESRYAMNAMELLINQMMRLGADRYSLTAKIFGGASILSAISPDFSMGMKNVESVVNFLITENIPIKNYNFGGKDSRRIYYHTDRDTVLLKRIKPKEVFKEFADLKIRTAEVEKKIKKTSGIIYFDD
jgi:chemotaxis receptor (MCP) glutamine deamidase CheD